jgi:Protein of unknown function (DUF3106)
MAPQYRGMPPGYGARPSPFTGPTPYRGAVPNHYAPSPARGPMYRPGMPYPAARGPYSAPQGNLRGQHLGSWLESHQGQSFASQENSLRREQGFSQLPQQQQQRLIDRLHQLDTMPPQQRQRTLGRIENMEQLSPERRQAVRNSAQELGGMDPGRQRQVRGAFRALRDLPPGQREQVLNSPAYRSMYSDHERQVLGNLLSVEPYTPR